MSGLHREWMRNFATVAGITATIATLWLASGRIEHAAAQGTAPHTPTVVRLADIPSHNERYRASLIPASGTVKLGQQRPWTVKVWTAAGAPVEGARLVIQSGMPETGRVTAPSPMVTEELGGGRYRVEGLRFDRDGWWNMSLSITAPAGNDSLAFNLVF